MLGYRCEMESLLKDQPDITLSEWKREHQVETITGYYNYLDLLCVHNGSSIDFPNDALPIIFSHLPSYALSAAKCVCQSWSMIETVPTCVTTYLLDAAYNVDWYHLVRAMMGKSRAVLSEAKNEALKRGYTLRL